VASEFKPESGAAIADRGVAVVAAKKRMARRVLRMASCLKVRETPYYYFFHWVMNS
jgi:hypothetical protein